jgi:hypothetical protein
MCDSWHVWDGVLTHSNGVGQVMMAAVQHSPHSGALHALRSELTDVRKFAVLNYIAVIKAVKKRNRHLGARLGASSLKPLRALDLLNAQHFYTSPKLAALSTQAEILLQVHACLHFYNAQISLWERHYQDLLGALPTVRDDSWRAHLAMNLQGRALSKKRGGCILGYMAGCHLDFYSLWLARRVHGE